MGCWWVSTNAELLANWYDKCYPFDEDFKWFAKFEKDRNFSNRNIIIWYIDTKWREWDSIEDRNWTLYVYKNWTVYNSLLI
jgi:hypothetical protein